MKLPNCKITILKRTLNQDLIDKYIIEDFQGITPCEKFKDGQEIVIDPNTASIPDGFCHWAWADIRQDINLIASGGNAMGMKEEGATITFCSDWTRPVYFKIERIE
jgi:uncharacterized repeat protein (TIGR04076 family)